MGISDCTAVTNSWVCSECKKKHRKGDSKCTPDKGISLASTSPTSQETDEAPLPHPLVLKDQPGEESEVRAMRRELTAYISEQRDFRKEIRASLKNLVGRVDGIEQRLEAVELRQAVEATSSVKVADLEQAVFQLKHELNERDQDNLLSDLDIGHLPEEKGENVIHIVTVLAAKLGVNLNEQDVLFAERIGAVDASSSSVGDTTVGGRPRRVVIRLARRHLRDELLTAARVRRNLSSADIGLSGPSRRVYINERLTKTNRLLFHRVREECRKRQWRYSWTKRGRIFAKQADGKQAYSFRSEVDFDRIFGNGTV